ncbi:MAG: trigger factor, partial [Litorivicinaceae bacterium]
KLERGALPAVDEEFIKTFGVDSGEEKDFKAQLKEQMGRELSLTLKNMNKTKVFDVLLDKNLETPVPESAVRAEIRTLKNQAVERFGGGQQFEPDQLPDDLFSEQAERRVRLGILLGATVKKLELHADADRVRALVDEMAAAYDDPDQVVNYYYSNDENLKQIEALAVEEQVAEKLLESAKVKAIDMSYADVMKSRQG